MSERTHTIETASVAPVETVEPQEEEDPPAPYLLNGLTDGETPVCTFCGMPICQLGQKCAALDIGGCRR